MRSLKYHHIIHLTPAQSTLYEPSPWKLHDVVGRVRFSWSSPLPRSLPGFVFISWLDSWPRWAQDLVVGLAQYFRGGGSFALTCVFCLEGVVVWMDLLY